MKNAEDLANRTIVDSEIPSGHPAKREIERGLRSALVGLPEEWRITVVCSRTSVWWVLRVDGPGFEWMTVLADPTKQNAPEMTGRLLAALRASKVLS
jgi:hypothetical protein